MQAAKIPGATGNPPRCSGCYDEIAAFTVKETNAPMSFAAPEFWNNAQLDHRAKMCKILKGKQNHNNPNNLHFDSEFGEPFNLNLFHTYFPS